MRNVQRQRVVITAVILFALLPTSVGAEAGVAPTAQGALFFDFGDEAGFSGGFSFWIGASIYPSLPATRDGLAFVVSPGVELRTGPIPVLTGPNQFSPQVRIGAADLGPDVHPDGSPSPAYALMFTDLKVQAILGYRWASDFGLDNLEGRRANEQAFRFGLDVTSVGLLRLTDPIPLFNTVAGIVDVNRDGSFDRLGFSVGFGF